MPSTGAQLAAALTPAFPASRQQLTTMGELLDQQPQDPAKLNEFHELERGLVTTLPQGVEDTGEAALLSSDTATAFGHAAAMAPHAAGGAEGIGNPFAGLWSGAREVLRTLSYYEMKNRAGVVGQHRLGPRDMVELGVHRRQGEVKLAVRRKATDPMSAVLLKTRRICCPLAITSPARWTGPTCGKRIGEHFIWEQLSRCPAKAAKRLSGFRRCRADSTPAGPAGVPIESSTQNHHQQQAGLSSAL